MIGTVVLVEWCLQLTLNATVDPSPPPTGTGLFPSGGTTRVIAVYGTILYLTLRRAQPSRSVEAAAWIALALTVFLEGFTRVFTAYHWVSDIAGGVLLGTVLLATSLAAQRALDGRGHRPPAPDGDALRRSEALT